MRTLLRDAFLLVCQGYSTDRVVADPTLNEAFIRVCRNAGLLEPAAVLNAELLNLRKSGALGGVSRSKKTVFKDQEEYRFASEVAARFLEHRSNLTVDQILCAPDLAREFDAIAARIAPGFQPLQYRWAALNLRKTKRLRPESISHVVASEATDLGPVQELKPESLPMAQGIYIFYSSTVTLYIGETSNLRKRVSRHLDHSDNKGLAHWFWENGFSNVHLEIRVLSSATSDRARCAIERELILSRKPEFNIQHL